MEETSKVYYGQRLKPRADLINYCVNTVGHNGRVFLIGGGPSIKADPEMIPTLKRLDSVGETFIAINDSFRLFPDSLVLHFGDDRWYEWNRDFLSEFKGDFITTAAPTRRGEYTRNGFLYFEKVSEEGLKDYPPYPPAHLWHGEIAGNNSGHQAINLATFMGATEIVLVGFDMNQGKDGAMQWHNNHKVASDPVRYKEVMAPAIDQLASILYTKGVKVFNTNPNSGVVAYPYRNIKEFIT